MEPMLYREFDHPSPEEAVGEEQWQIK